MLILTETGNIRYFSTVKKLDSQLPKNLFLIFNESPLKMIKNAILFHVKNSFYSWDIYVLVLTFWLCRKTA